MTQEIFNRNGRTLAEIIESTIETEQALFDNGGELTPELEAIMAKDAADMEKKIDGYNAAYREEDARAKALGEEIKRLQGLKKTAENSARRIKDLLKYNMERLGVERVNGTTCKAYFSTSTAVACDEDELLKPYDVMVEDLQRKMPVYVRVSLEVSKTDLKTSLQALGEDETIAGAALQKNRSIVLK